MDKIKKIINIDNSRSHRNGLLPFVHYDENKISFVNEQMPNGNYGKYVCDLTIFEKNNDEYIEINRMKYLDIIRRYSFVHKVLKNGVLVKKINFEETNIIEINCLSGTTSVGTIERIRFITDFDEIDTNVLYNYTPLDINFFNEENSIYNFVKPTDDENRLKEKITQHETLIKENEFFILIQNYDDVIDLNNLWINWIIVEGCDDWREKVFGKNKKNEDCDVPDLQFYSDVNKYILGLTEVPSKYDGSLVPQYIDYFKCAESIEWFETNSASTMAAESLETEENVWILNNWNERGGGDFYEFLKKISPIWQSENEFIQIGDKNSNKYFKYTEPFININVLINSEYDYETLYDVYEYSAKNNEFEGAVKPYSAPTSGFGSGLTKQWLNLEGNENSAMCESQLSTLKHSDAVMVSDKIFGIYSVYDDDKPESGQMFKCTKYSGSTIHKTGNQIVCEKEYSDGFVWWECEKVTNENILNNIKCGDGEYIEGGKRDKYRNVTILSCIESVAGYVDYGKEYYFLSRYDNSKEKPIEPPYKINEPVNIVTYDNGDVVYDKVFPIEYNEEKTIATIRYAKGITSGATEEESGIHYEEVLSCELEKKEVIPIDGVYMAEVYYNEIGFDGDKVEVYSEEYNLTRKTNLARITGMEICTQWTEESAVDAMLITRDGSEGLQEEPKYNLNLLYNRGNAAGYESHFKLSECNTMEDLENYSNNFFNL